MRVPVQVAMNYNSSYTENVVSYVNTINTYEGGTHVIRLQKMRFDPHPKGLC
jgi:DNA gyrase/topoisomerase IV subunit B